jgi:hypothetical protein
VAKYHQSRAEQDTAQEVIVRFHMSPPGESECTEQGE